MMAQGGGDYFWDPRMGADRVQQDPRERCGTESLRQVVLDMAGSRGEEWQAERRPRAAGCLLEIGRLVDEPCPDLSKSAALRDHGSSILSGLTGARIGRRAVRGEDQSRPGRAETQPSRRLDRHLEAKPAHGRVAAEWREDAEVA